MGASDQDVTGAPSSHLGDNFTEPYGRELMFSDAAQVYGSEEKASWSPDPKRASELAGEDVSHVFGEVQHRDKRCVYCGLVTSTLDLDSVNDVHFDVSPENLVGVDRVCHGYHHLGSLGPQAARIVYVPGLSSIDVNHLQRLLAGLLAVGSDEDKETAKQLVIWLASHDAYVRRTFGSHNPQVFAAALRDTDNRLRDKRQTGFEDLAVAYNPVTLMPDAGVVHAELLSEHPRESWHRYAGEVLRLIP